MTQGNFVTPAIDAGTAMNPTTIGAGTASRSGTAESQISVLMLGPDRSVHGGISGVVNNLYDAGLDQHIHLTYIGTMKEGGKAYKLWTALVAYLKFLRVLPKCDIVHVNMSSDRSYLRKSIFVKKAASAGKNILIHQHGGDIVNYYRNLSQRGQIRMQNVFKMADRIIALSGQSRSFLTELIGTDENITVMPNAVKIPPRETTEAMPEPRDNETTESPRETQGNETTEAMPEPRGYETTSNSRTLLFLGRICKDKGIDELLEALDTINSEAAHRVKLIIGGIFEDEKYKYEFEKRSDYIEYLGWVSGQKKEEVLKRADILVLPSYYEGMPVCVLDAMAYGCPVIATEVGGIPTMIEDGISGILIKPRDVVSLREGIVKLVNDPDLCKRLSDMAYAKVSKDFNIDNTVDSLIRIYEEIYKKDR